MSAILRSGARLSLLACLGLITTTALAEDQPYTEGHIIQINSVRTEYGHFDDYMKFLDTTWKREMEAEKKAGLILSYEVLTADARGPDDPDIYLVVTFRNWAALDGLPAKSEAIAKQVYGSLSEADKGAVDRGKMRRVIGTMTMQALNLK